MQKKKVIIKNFINKMKKKCSIEAELNRAQQNDERGTSQHHSLGIRKWMPLSNIFLLHLGSHHQDPLVTF